MQHHTTTAAASCARWLPADAFALQQATSQPPAAAGPAAAVARRRRRASLTLLLPASCCHTMSSCGPQAGAAAQQQQGWGRCAKEPPPFRAKEHGLCSIFSLTCQPTRHASLSLPRRHSANEIREEHRPDSLRPAVARFAGREDRLESCSQPQGSHAPASKARRFRGWRRAPDDRNDDRRRADEELEGQHELLRRRHRVQQPPDLHITPAGIQARLSGRTTPPHTPRNAAQQRSTQPDEAQLGDAPRRAPP